jgi:hypothetical protein
MVDLEVHTDQFSNTFLSEKQMMKNLILSLSPAVLMTAALGRSGGRSGVRPTLDNS